jgi:hypothetical protein
MIRYTKEYIGNLLDKYMDGTSTLDEEAILSEYFRGKDIPQEWEDYRQLFQEIEDMRPQAQTIKRRMGWPYKWIAIAASLLILVGIGFGVRQYQDLQKQYAIYEGSYIIRDGKKITDIKQILPELEATEREVSEILKQQNNNQEIPTI